MAPPSLKQRVKEKELSQMHLNLISMACKGPTGPKLVESYALSASIEKELMITALTTLITVNFFNKNYTFW